MIAKRTQENIPAAEWVVAGIGVLFVAVIMVMLLIDAMQADESPPAIAVACSSRAPSAWARGWWAPTSPPTRGSLGAPGLHSGSTGK